MDGPRVSRVSRRMSKVVGRVVVERSDPTAVSRELWKGLVKFNREQAGPLRYRRTVLSVRDGKGRLLGGLILLSYWRESYIELLWLSARARKAGFGSRLIKEAERRARQPPDSPEHVLVPGARLLREARLSALRRNIGLSARREPAFLREAPIRPRRWGKTNRVEHGYVDKDCPESNA